MSDLTREVLKEFYDWWKVHREDSTDALSDPGRDLIHAAPILARQIEDVERVLADAEEWIGPVARNDYDEGMAELIDRILSALTDTAHYWSEPLQGGPQ